MTKPHEETWTYDGGATIANHDALILKHLSIADIPTPSAPGRLRLAAQAPAMARLLIEVHSGTGTGFCVFCGRHPDDHADCALATVLRAAGVLP